MVPSDASSLRRLVRVLVVDDSAFVRQTLRALMVSSREIEVVGTAVDGEEALKQVERLQPDVVTLDLEMPRMDGFSFLRIQMRRRPVPVIVVSSFSERQTVLRALELGALDFVAKPDRAASPNLRTIRRELVDKVLAGAGSLVEQLRLRLDPLRDSRTVAAVPEPALRRALGLVVIATSTGGPSSLRRVLPEIPPRFPYGILVAQHMPERFTRAFAERLDRATPLPVREAEAGDPVFGGHVYVAPGGHHLEVVSSADGFVLALSPARPGDRYVPSADRLLTSAAEAAGRRTVAIVLTGMGSDGAMGAQYVQVHGGQVAAESQETAVVFGMPRAAIDAGGVGEVVPLDRVAGWIQRAVVGR